jgi:two-component system cell cycle sensor histidine kinase/response regulator CckA
MDDVRLVHGKWRPGVAARVLSFRVKLFLVIVALLATAITLLGWAAYREMRSSALAATDTRLGGIAKQWSQLLEGNAARQRAALRSFRDSASIRDALRTPSAQTRAAAAVELRGLASRTQRAALQIFDEKFALVARAGDSTLFADSASTRPILDSVATADSGAVGPLRVSGAIVLATTAVRIVDGSRVIGYLALTTQIRVSPSPEVVNRLFGGDSTSMRLANRDGSLWTDLSKPIPAAATSLAGGSKLATYVSPVTGPVFAAIRPVAGTPYVVVLETGQGEVLSQARRFLVRIVVVGAVMIGMGLLLAFGVSGSFTGPVARLTAAVEAVAAGNYSHQSGLPARQDELGRLANAFDAMVTSVEASFASRRAAEEYYRRLFESVPLPLWVYDLATLRILDVNDAVVQHYGYSREEILRMTLEDIRPPEDIPRLREAVRSAAGPEFGGVEWRHIKKDGSTIYVETYAHGMEYHGRPARIAVIHDITERKKSRDAIRRLDDRLRRLVHDSHDGITLSTQDGRFLAVNPAFARMLGYSSEELLALKTTALFQNADQRQAFVAKIADVGHLHRAETQLRRKDGSLITVLFTARMVTDPVTGDNYLEAVTQDVTELRRVERQFQQAQKMEAVGQLAAGVAHDFNNLLTVVLSYTEILLAEPSLAASSRREVQAIRDAGVSAGSLTRQLLVFSRQEVIEPKVTQLNALVLESAKMLTRLLGEHVELATRLDSDAGSVKVDAGQIEQVIVNLAVNARDAMPDGGQLLIESRNAEFSAEVPAHAGVIPAGQYVTLSVSDNGAGMNAETQARIFEPFFTTKELGKGTGLGLATVYGIVKQSGGYISVYSEPGHGTSFKVYFPRCAEVPSAASALPTAAATAGGAETVLVVEDQPAVRTVVCRLLRRNGYNVLEAPGGAEALEIASQHHGTISLLLTDVIMPRMSGRELSDKVVEVVPHIKTLFVSGYTDDAIVHQGVLDRQMQFLQKPFAPDALLRKIREVLDGKAAAA